MPPIVPSSFLIQGVKCPRDHKIFSEIKKPTILEQESKETPLSLSIDKVGKEVVLGVEISRDGELEEDKIELSE